MNGLEMNMCKLGISGQGFGSDEAGDVQAQKYSSLKFQLESTAKQIWLELFVHARSRSN